MSGFVFQAAVPWHPVRPAVSPVLRLTRRGRQLRGLSVASVILVMSMSGHQMVGHGQALDAVPVSGTRVSVTQPVVVEQGDSLWAIAERYAPHSDPREVVAELRKANGLDSNLIQPGMVIQVPTGL